tara:strand:- start:1237 stop:1878 length:642 start_codon:yes stop_codon:yes gene_type:complete
MSTSIEKIIECAGSIKDNFIDNTQEDGRIASAIAENPYLNRLQEIIGEKYPRTKFEIKPARSWCDFMVDDQPFNLKITGGKSADNAMNKLAIVYTLTGSFNGVSNTMNMNDMFRAIKNKGIKKERDKNSEYIYLVINKKTLDFICKSILDLKEYKTNPSNILQINWKNEFENKNYVCEDHIEKIDELFLTIKKSEIQRQSTVTELMSWESWNI